MTKLNFLRKLKKEGKLKIVEPSENVKEAYLAKSSSYLESAKLLLKNKKLEESISMAYYSMYYSLLALLYRIGIKSENHMASIFLLKRLFDIDNREIIRAKKERIDKQYYVDFDVTEKDVKSLIRTAENFNAIIFDYLERLSLEKIEKIRESFKKLI